MEIPANDFLKSSKQNVYPIPPDILFGSIVYQGSGNTMAAENFLVRLTELGLVQATLADLPYRHLNIDENGNPPESHWEPDNHSIGFIYKLNDVDFKTIFDESNEYFNSTNLNIYLYTSNGDQGLMSKSGGVTVVFAE